MGWTGNGREYTAQVPRDFGRIQAQFGGLWPKLTTLAGGSGTVPGTGLPGGAMLSCPDIAAWSRGFDAEVALIYPRERPPPRMYGEKARRVCARVDKKHLCQVGAVPVLSL